MGNGRWEQQHHALEDDLAVALTDYAPFGQDGIVVVAFGGSSRRLDAKELEA